MSFIDALEREGGPFAEAARKFLEPRGGADGFPHGPHGARQIARFIEELADDADESQFIEGAGALLGMLLISAQRGARHDVRGSVHRVRFGRFGFFDPFGAIDQALDASSPRAALATAIREAEAEARGEGPMSRVLLALDRALVAMTPPRHIAYAFEHHVELDDGIELDVRSLVDSTRGESSELIARNVQKLIDLLPGGSGSIASWDDIAARVMPRLVGDKFLAQLGAASEGLCLQKLAPGVSIAFVLRFEGRARYVRARELAVGVDAILEAAVTNLRAASERTRVIADPYGIAVRNGDGLDAARLLLPELRGALEDKLRGPFVAAVPHRDAFYACADETVVAMALAARAEDEHARAPHPICPRLLRVSARGVT